MEDCGIIVGTLKGKHTFAEAVVNLAKNQVTDAQCQVLKYDTRYAIVDGEGREKQDIDICEVERALRGLEDEVKVDEVKDRVRSHTVDLFKNEDGGGRVGI